MNYSNYSVLMSVYYKEKPDNLRMAMDSMWNQSIPSDDFVLVCDGPLNPELDSVISTMEKDHPGVINVIRLERNEGLGKALNIGMDHCKNDLVARMDSDDISRPYRCERQLEYFCKNAEVSIVSGTVEEFEESVEKIKYRKNLPEHQDEIVLYARKRNPFNHPCVMFKKDDVKKAGGYQDFYLLEDYYLWTRMFQNGCKGYNIQEPLLWMRTGADIYKRRSGIKYALSQRNLFKYMKNCGLINSFEYTRNVFIRCMSSMIPNYMRRFLFHIFLRTKNDLRIQ